MASRSAGMKCGFGSRFWPAGRVTSEGKPASRARRGWWVPQPGRDLSEVPAVSANYLAGASTTHLAMEHLFLHRVSPFPNTAELVVACFGNAEAGAHTSGWERGRQQATPHPPSRTSTKKKKKILRSVL